MNGSRCAWRLGGSVRRYVVKVVVQQAGRGKQKGTRARQTRNRTRGKVHLIEGVRLRVLKYMIEQATRVRVAISVTDDA